MYEAIGWMLAGGFVTIAAALMYGYVHLLLEDRKLPTHPNCVKCNGYPLSWITSEEYRLRQSDYLCSEHHNRWAQMRQLERELFDREWVPGEWR